MSRALMGALLSGLLPLAGHAAPAPLELTVGTPAEPPRADRPRVDRDPIPVVPVDVHLRLDGRADEAAWERATWGPSLRSLRGDPPPDPAWRHRAVAAPGGLGLHLAGLPADATARITVDPDGTRQGWLRVDLVDGAPTLADCRATPDDARMPVPMGHRVHKWDCRPPVPAQAAHGPDGWEVLLPWSTLQPVTDDLTLVWQARTETHSGTLEVLGNDREYPTLGRTLAVDGRAERADRVGVTLDRGTGTLEVRLALRDRSGPEVWTWEAMFAGLPLEEGVVRLEPDEKGRAEATWRLPYDGRLGLVVRARQIAPTPEPPVPGAWNGLFSPRHRAHLATPIFRDHLEVRANLEHPVTVPVVVRRPGGEVLARGRAELPRGRSWVRMPADPAWPNHLEIAVGDLFPEVWLPLARQGVTARTLGAP